jgi:hypothetical protein
MQAMKLRKKKVISLDLPKRILFDEVHQETKAEHKQARRSHSRKGREEKEQDMKCRKKKVISLDLTKQFLCEEVDHETKATTTKRITTKCITRQDPGDGHGLRSRRRSASRDECGARAGATEPRAEGPRAEETGHEVPGEQTHLSRLTETNFLRRSASREEGGRRTRAPATTTKCIRGRRQRMCRRDGATRIRAASRRSRPSAGRRKSSLWTSRNEFCATK